MIELSAAQTRDLIGLSEICARLSTEVVVIGAVAYATFIEDSHRHTNDIDVAVALDLDDFREMQKMLEERHWTQRKEREHRWYGPHGGIVDILPAGPRIRAEQQIIWPISQMRMSVVGFDHVFSKAQWHQVAPGLRIKVVPLPVLTFLKMVSYLDRPGERERDLRDLGELLRRYESENDERRFSDEIIERQIDYGSAGAFLLGMDLSGLCSEMERSVVERFMAEINDKDGKAYGFLERSRAGLWDDDREDRRQQLNSQILAFMQGFQSGRERK
jgi:predicted nucleotidyltransferase